MIPLCLMGATKTEALIFGVCTLTLTYTTHINPAQFSFAVTGIGQVSAYQPLVQQVGRVETRLMQAILSEASFL
ncbi:hypothetical protein [Methyloglobulus sp.]|uniref:hypothetical protein n=1 Tax=Methyloglobulus sp. TaxID=2518622 RepID=UPI0032B878C6